MGSGGPDDNDAQAGRLIVSDSVRSHPRPGSNSVGLITAFHPTGGGAKDLSPTDNLAPGTGTGGTVGIATAIGVRRLTPTECERLQSFPDGWTQLGDTADSKRCSALGDAVTVSVSEWIGSRLPA